MNNDRNFDNNPSIIPINNISDTEQNNINPINKDNTSSPKETPDDFVHSLPNWDLVPPYETVRRINRI